MTPKAQPYENDFDKEEADQDAAVTPAAPDPDEPRDETALDSFGRAVSEVVTGPVEDGQVDRRSPEGKPPHRA